MKHIVVVDYGLGNILSVARAFEHIGCTVRVTSCPKDIERASKIVIPGVGAFPTAVQRLESLGLRDALREAGISGIPILGICLGMQLLFTTGHEYFETPGLGFIGGQVRRMTAVSNSDGPLRLPEVGWRRIDSPTKRAGSIHPVFGDTAKHFFYFVHSYEAKPVDPTVITGSYQRADALVIASVAYKNIFGVQYHPEKSGKPGLEFLQRFVQLASD